MSVANETKKPAIKRVVKVTVNMAQSPSLLDLYPKAHTSRLPGVTEKLKEPVPVIRREPRRPKDLQRYGTGSSLRSEGLHVSAAEIARKRGYLPSLLSDPSSPGVALLRPRTVS